MNRRSFITKALAGLAVVPVLGKLVNSQPQTLADSFSPYAPPFEFKPCPVNFAEPVAHYPLEPFPDR